MKRVLKSSPSFGVAGIGGARTRMAGKPAVTKHHSGRGWVFYAGVDSTDDEFYEVLGHAVGETAGLTPLVAAPRGVEVTSRQDGQTTYYFLLNMTGTAHESIELPRPMEDLINQKAGVTSVSLGPLGVAVLALRS